jgi:hypothetical protein
MKRLDQIDFGALGMASYLNYTDKFSNFGGVNGVMDIVKMPYNRFPWNEKFKVISPLELYLSSNPSLRAIIENSGSLDMKAPHLAAISFSALEMFQTQRKLSSKLEGLLDSQLGISQSLARLGIGLPSKSLETYAPLSILFGQSTSSFLKGLNDNADWESDENSQEDIAIVTKAFETVSRKTSDIDFEDDRDVLLKELDAIKDDLSKLVSRSNRKSVYDVIFKLMNILSFVIAVCSLFNENGDRIEKLEPPVVSPFSPKDSVEVSLLLTSRVSGKNEVRVAVTNVNLRRAPRKRSKKIGLVQAEQAVWVIERYHKWILICFVDQESGEPKSGYVFKKYFEPLK